MNKKGFTLIELLAVITILAVLALITIPVVNNTIKNSKNKIYENSVIEYAKAVKSAASLYELDNYTAVTGTSTSIGADGKTVIINGKSLNIEYTGNKVKCDSVTINNDGTVKLTNCIVAEKSSSITFDESTNTISGSSSTNTSTICTLQSGTKGSVGSKYSCKVNTSDTFTFYLLSTNSSTSYNLIMEKNICSDGTVATSSNKCTTAWHAENNNSTFGPTTAMTYLNNATDEWSNISNINIDYTNEYKIKTTSSSTTITAGTKISTIDSSQGTGAVVATFNNLKARLPYTQELFNAGCGYAHAGDGRNCPTWLIGYLAPSSSVTGTTTITGINGYWTADGASNDNTAAHAFILDNNAKLNFAGVITSSTEAGVRPVITVSSSDIG